jgi:toxin ParE1/3/4
MPRSKRRLVVSPAAERDFESILSFIARDKPGAALSFVKKLRARCTTLAKNPFVGEDCSLLRPETRRVAVEGYLIFFRVGADAVEVVRVIHGARDWPALFP